MHNSFGYQDCNTAEADCVDTGLERRAKAFHTFLGYAAVSMNNVGRQQCPELCHDGILEQSD